MASSSSGGDCNRRFATENWAPASMKIMNAASSGNLENNIVGRMKAYHRPLSSGSTHRTLASPSHVSPKSHSYLGSCTLNNSLQSRCLYQIDPAQTTTLQRRDIDLLHSGNGNFRRVESVHSSYKMLTIMQRRIDGLESANLDLTNQIDKLKKSPEITLADVPHENASVINESMLKLQHKIDSLSQENDSLQREILRTKEQSSDTLVARHEHEIGVMRHQLESLKLENSNLQKELKTLDVLQSSLGEKVCEVNSIQLELNSALLEIESLKAKVSPIAIMKMEQDLECDHTHTDLKIDDADTPKTFAKKSESSQTSCERSDKALQVNIEANEEDLKANLPGNHFDDHTIELSKYKNECRRLQEKLDQLIEFGVQSVVHKKTDSYCPEKLVNPIGHLSASSKDEYSKAFKFSWKGKFPADSLQKKLTDIARVFEEARSSLSFARTQTWATSEDMFNITFDNAKKSTRSNQQEQQARSGDIDTSVVRVTVLCDWCLTDKSHLPVRSEESFSSKTLIGPEVLIPRKNSDILPFPLVDNVEKLTSYGSLTLKEGLRTISSSSSRQTKPPVPTRPKSSNDCSLRSGRNLQSSSRVSTENHPLFAGGMIMIDYWN